jgi:hypothetical protein
MDKKQAKQEHKQLFDDLKKIIDRYDFVGLFKNTPPAPEDEYEDEVAMVLTNIKTCKSVEEIESLLSLTFKIYFGKEYSEAPRYRSAAEEIYNKVVSKL